MASNGRRSDPDRQTARLLNDRVSSGSFLRPLARPRLQKSPRRAAHRGILPHAPGSVARRRVSHPSGRRGSVIRDVLHRPVMAFAHRVAPGQLRSAKPQARNALPRGRLDMAQLPARFSPGCTGHADGYVHLLRRSTQQGSRRPRVPPGRRLLITRSGGGEPAANAVGVALDARPPPANRRRQRHRPRRPSPTACPRSSPPVTLPSRSARQDEHRQQGAASLLPPRGQVTL